MSLPPPPERAALARLLADLQAAVEDLLLTGLAAASEATRQTLFVSFEAASRMRLLRLGFTLRVATEELGRFARNDPSFSRRRFAFFLSRAWMLSHGLQRALAREDEEHWRQLTRQPGSRAVASLDLVSLGVAKRVVPGAFAAFEFRLRTLRAVEGLGAGAPVVWSVVFPLKPDVELAAEACLHLPQPQGFKPNVWLPGKAVRVTGATLTEDGRLNLSRESRVESLDERVADWEPLLAFDPRRALERLVAHQPGPFDLEIELHEELALRDFKVGKPEVVEREHQLRFPVATPEGEYVVVTGTGGEDAPLREALGGWTRTQKRPLFGVLHYEMCRFVFQPLTFFAADGPVAVQLKDAAFDAASLVKALKFT